MENNFGTQIRQYIAQQDAQSLSSTPTTKKGARNGNQHAKKPES